MAIEQHPRTGDVAVRLADHDRMALGRTHVLGVKTDGLQIGSDMLGGRAALGP